MNIRPSIESDKKEILHVHLQAFGKEEGPEIEQLVTNLFADPTALPIFSLVAEENDVIIGHILYTKVTVKGASDNLSAQLLAPLAVAPGIQSKGVGVELVSAGLRELKKAGTQLVFVLGHPDYYPRCGFSPAGAHGFDAPYPIPEKNAGAWMVQELKPGIIGIASGMVQCCEALDKPEYWRE